MSQALGRLVALCVLAAFVEQLTAGSRLRGGLRLIEGILAAQIVLEAMMTLPGALFS